MDVSFQEVQAWLLRLSVEDRAKVLQRIPVNSVHHLKKNEYSRVVRIAKAILEEKDSNYNWKSEGPGGCDAHGIEHPCGRCIADPKY